MIWEGSTFALRAPSVMAPSATIKEKTGTESLALIHASFIHKTSSNQSRPLWYHQIRLPVSFSAVETDNNYSTHYDRQGESAGHR
jgi:hypothetical protein